MGASLSLPATLKQTALSLGSRPRSGGQKRGSALHRDLRNHAVEARAVPLTFQSLRRQSRGTEELRRSWDGGAPLPAQLLAGRRRLFHASPQVGARKRKPPSQRPLPTKRCQSQPQPGVTHDGRPHLKDSPRASVLPLGSPSPEPSGRGDHPSLRDPPPQASSGPLASLSEGRGGPQEILWRP